MNPPTFALCTFSRVFDVEPCQTHVDLDTLCRVLRRFEIRSDIPRKTQRETARLDHALASVQRGQPAKDRRSRELAAATDPVALHAQKCIDLVRAQKTDLRLWSPAAYHPGARRGSDGVRSLSCLVLDIDQDGPSPDQASDQWSDWLHLVHTTWSHRDNRPKYRIILPLAAPVLAADWPTVWQWAAARAPYIDPAPSGVAATYALPALPSRDAPHRAFLFDAPLLNPRSLGLVDQVDTPGRPPGDPASRFVPGHPDRRVVQCTDQRSGLVQATLESPDSWDLFGDPPAEPSPPVTPADPLTALFDPLRRKLEAGTLTRADLDEAERKLRTQTNK